MTVSPIVLLIVGLYLCGMLLLGVWASKSRIKDADDFMVAGRRLPWYILAATLAATEVGGGSCMGVTQKAYGKWGLGSAWYIWTMAITFMIFALVAPMLTRTRCRTIPQFFRERYGDRSAVMASFLMIVSLIGLTAVQMIATGKIIQLMTGMAYIHAVILSGIVVIFYTYMGGMWSVSLTDFVQWIFIVVGMAAAIPYALSKAGGYEKVMATLPPGKLSLFEGIGIGQIVSLVVIYCTSFLVGQEAMQRLYSAKDETNARLGSLATSAFYVIFGFIPPALGIIAYSLAGQGIISAAQLEAAGRDGMLPLVASYCLPTFLTGILFAGLISATMSSADSDLLGAASIWSNDLAPIFWGGDKDTALCMQRTKQAVFIVGIAGTVVACFQPQSIISMLKFSFGLRAAGPFFPFLLGHFWPRGSSLGAESSIAGATILVAILKYTGYEPWGIDPVIPGLVLGGILYLLFSILIPDKGIPTEKLPAKA